MRMPVSEDELDASEGMKTPTSKQKFRSGKSARIGALMRIISLLTNPLPGPALPPPPPPALSDIAKPKDRSGQGEFESKNTLPTAMLMEYLGKAATETESEEEAAAFIGSLIPIAGRMLPQVAPALMHTSPDLIRGLTAATSILRQNPATRSLVRTIPTVVHHTATSMNRQLLQGMPVTPQTAMKSLSKAMHRILGSAEQSQQAFKRSQAAIQRYSHQFSNLEYEAEMAMELAFQEIEHMTRSRKQMTESQKQQILSAINECWKNKERTKGKRRSTKDKHEQGEKRFKSGKWNRAQRIFQNEGFPAALNDAKRC